MAYGDALAHAAACPRRPAPCPYPGCGATLRSFSEVAEHFESMHNVSSIKYTRPFDKGFTSRYSQHSNMTWWLVIEKDETPFVLYVERDYWHYRVLMYTFGEARRFRFACSFSGKEQSMTLSALVYRVRLPVGDTLAGFVLQNDTAHWMSETHVIRSEPYDPNHIYELHVKGISIEPVAEEIESQ